MIRQLLFVTLALTLVNGRPDKLDAELKAAMEAKAFMEAKAAMEAKSAMEAKAVMESKAAMEAKAAMGKSSEQVSGKGGSDVNDGGRLLSLPEADACAQRPKHWERNGHWYFLSTNVSSYADIKSDWLDARNLCRKHCMDAISIETVEENDMVLDILEKQKLPYIWTSGRLCNFKGCDREDLQPVLINGWFWSGSGVKLAKTNETPAGWGYQPWSATGHFKRAQPDNAEFEINETKESCLGVLNNVYKDGIKWHDIGCYHTKAVICEDSPPLLQYISATNPTIKL